MTTWRWRLPQLYEELGISEADLALRALIRRPTANKLRNQRDTYTSVLVSLYLAARRVKSDVTLHSFLAVEGAPAIIELRPQRPLDEMEPMPNLPGIYLGTPLLRRRLGTQGESMTVRELAMLCQLDETTLSRMEHGHLQPKVSTLLRIYAVCLERDPTLTLHDVLLIHDRELQPRPLVRPQAKTPL
jgi:DNA-binding XRE family transcriptional regulator